MAETHSQPVWAADRGALECLQHCAVCGYPGGLPAPEALHVHCQQRDCEHLPLQERRQLIYLWRPAADRAPISLAGCSARQNRA